MNAQHLIFTVAWTLVGAAAGFGIRRLSVWLARLEELEPGARPWQVWAPVVTAAAVFGAFAWAFGPEPLLLVKSLWAAVLVQVIFFDLEHRLILDRLMFPMMGAALLFSIWTPGLGWKQSLLAGIGSGALFLVIALAGAGLFRAEVMGMGDVKLALFIGLTLGFYATVQALVLGVVLAGLVSVALIAVRLKGLRDTIAYGPYLCLGALWILLVAGPR